MYLGRMWNLAGVSVRVLNGSGFRFTDLILVRLENSSSFSAPPSKTACSTTYRHIQEASASRSSSIRWSSRPLTPTCLLTYPPPSTSTAGAPNPAHPAASFLSHLSTCTNLLSSLTHWHTLQLVQWNVSTIRDVFITAEVEGDPKEASVTQKLLTQNGGYSRKQ